MITYEQTDILYINELLNISMQENKLETQQITSVNKLVGDASTRRYYRATLENEHLVVCLTTVQEEDRLKSDFIKIQEVLKENDIRCPNILDYDLSKGYILLEDLGDTTLLKGLSKIEANEDEFSLYKRVLDILIHMQTIDIKKYPDRVFSQRFFDTEKFNFEKDFSKKYFMHKFLEVTDLDNKIDDSFNIVHEKLANQPKVFVHRDFHSRNIMIKDSELVCIDFQDARTGLAHYDLASMLDDCYYSISHSNREKLLTYYFEKSNSPGSFEDFMKVYNFMVVQRIFKALGTFTYIYSVRNDDRYLKYVGYAFENLRKTLSRIPELSSFNKVISKAYYDA